MPRLGVNLYRLLYKRNGYFTPESIFSLAIQMLNILEQIHAVGFVHNDLSLNNLMLGYDVSSSKLTSTDDDIFARNNVHLVDMGFASPYFDEKS